MSCIEELLRAARAASTSALLVVQSWLTARPAVVDIPERAEVVAGVQVSEAGRSEVRSYVLIFMPLAAGLLGVAVWAYRRALENKPYKPHGGARTS